MNTTNAALWQDYQQRLYHYVYRRVSNKADTEDIVQNIFIKIQQHPPQISQVQKLEGWLLQVTKNALVDYWRKQKPTEPLAEDWADHLIDEEEDKSANEENPWLNLSCCLLAMIGDLPEKYRHAVDLADLQQIKHKEIAQMMGISESGVKSRVKRGREKLRDLLVSCCAEDCQCHEKTPEAGCCHRAS